MKASRTALYIGRNEYELLKAARVGAEMTGWRMGFAGYEALYLEDDLPPWDAVAVALDGGQVAVFRDWGGGLQWVALDAEREPSNHAARMAAILRSVEDGSCDATHFRNAEIDLLLAEFISETDLGAADANASLFLLGGTEHDLFVATTTAPIARSDWVTPRHRQTPVTGYVLDGNEYHGAHDTSRAGNTPLPEPDRILALPVASPGAPPQGILRIAHHASLAAISQPATELAQRISAILQSTPNPPFVARSEIILGPDGRPARPEHAARVLGLARIVNEEFLEQLSRRPSLAHELTPRVFEELVAELYVRKGFSVELTPVAKDGGVDIWASKHEDWGALLYLVECKRWAPDRRVGVEVVRGLYGVVNAEEASAGVVVSTSGFTRGAIDFRRQRPYRLHLTELADLAPWFRAGAGAA